MPGREDHKIDDITPSGECCEPVAISEAPTIVGIEDDEITSNHQRCLVLVWGLLRVLLIVRLQV